MISQDPLRHWDQTEYLIGSFTVRRDALRSHIENNYIKMYWSMRLVIVRTVVPTKSDSDVINLIEIVM